MSDFVRCIKGVLTELRDMESIDKELREEIADQLEAVMSMDPDTATGFARAKIALESAEVSMLKAKVTSLRQEQFDAGFRQGRFDENEVGAVEAADNLRRAVSPKWGNRGDREVGSWANHVEALASDLKGRLDPVIRYISDTRWGLNREGDMAMDFRAAAVGAEYRNPESMEMAQLFHEVTQDMMQRLENAGVPVQQMENWFPRDPDMGRIHADLDGFKQWMAEALDPRHHPDPVASVEAFLNTQYRVVSGTSSSPNFTFGRQMRFKSSDHELEYFLRWGESNTVSQVSKVINRMAITVSSAEQFGPMGTRMLNTRVDEIRAAAVKQYGADSKQAKRAMRDAERARDLVTAEMDFTGRPESQTWANWVASSRLFASSVALGKTALSQISEDSMNALIQGRFITGGFGRSFGTAMKAMFDIATNNKGVRDLMVEQGVWLNAISANGSSRMPISYDASTMVGVLGPSASASEKARQMAQQAAIFTQRATLSQRVEAFQRSSIHLRNHRAMTRWVKNYSWDELPQRVRTHIFENNGLKREDFNALSKLDVEEHGVLSIPQLKENFSLNKKYMGAMHRESQIQIVKPDVDARWILSMGLDPSTIGGRAMQLLTQFLPWPTAVFRNSIGRDAMGGGIGIIGWASARVMAAMMTLQIYQFVSGRPVYEPDSVTLWRNAIARSGVFSPVGEMLLDAADPGSAQSLPGIVPSTVSGLFRTGGQFAKSTFDGDTDKAAAQLVRGVKPLAPNWWWSEWFTNAIMDNAINELDPGYARRIERMYEQQGRVGY